MKIESDIKKLIPVYADNMVNVSSMARTDVQFSAAAEKSMEKLIKPEIIQPPIVDKKFIQYPEPWSRWGVTNNQFPYLLIKYVQKCGLLARSIQTLASFMAANGVFFYTISNGMIQEADPKYLKRWRAAKGPRWLYRSAMDYWTFGAPFTKYIYDSSPKRKPLFIAHENASYCRWEKQNLQTRTIDIGFISNQWDTMFADPGKAPDEYVQIVQALDPFLAELQLSEMNEPIYMIGMDNYTPDSFYYPSQPWHSTDILKYVDILAALPEIEQSVYENSCSVNMQIFVDLDYLAWRMGYPSATDGTFVNESPEKKMAMNRTIQSEVETFITGQSKQHKTLLSLKYYDQNGTMRTAVDFKPVESIVNMGKNIPSSQNASGKLLESFGLDPAMLGSVMSDTKSRGGGSDKEAAMMALQNWLQPHRTNLLFAAEIFMRQMGMPDDVFMGIRDIRNSDDVAMHGGRAFTSDMPIIKK